MKSSDYGDFDFDPLAESFSYTKQIIINLNQDQRPALVLKAKWDEKHPHNQCVFIDGEDVKEIHFRPAGAPNELSKIPSKSDDVFRIYVVGHGEYGTSVIGDKRVNHIDLAKYLSDFIKDKKAVINLAVCGGGRGIEASPNEKTVASFAAKLQRFLGRFTGQNQLVVARTHMMAVNTAGKKATTDLSSPWRESHIGANQEVRAKEHQQPGSKIIITSESGQQEKLDAYYHLWKPKVLKKLAAALKHTKHPDKQKFLNEWLTKFENMNNHDIANMLELELQNKDSPLRLHTNIISKLFRDADTFTTVKSLVEEWHRINKSEYTFKDAKPLDEEAASSLEVKKT